MCEGRGINDKVDDRLASIVKAAANIRNLCKKLRKANSVTGLDLLHLRGLAAQIQWNADSIEEEIENARTTDVPGDPMVDQLNHIGWNVHDEEGEET